MRRCLLVSAGVLVAGAAQAGPVGERVVAGKGTISRPDARTTVVDQRSQALTINWRGFDVDPGEAVRFDQPNASSAVLNRVLNESPSQILGSIQANGKVFIMNGSGVVFGEGARVNVGGLFATSLDIDTADFMAGRYQFEARDGEVPGPIVNRGMIEAASGGFVTLAGGAVSNEGLIVADMGQVHLAAGRRVTLDFDGDGLIRFEVDGDLLERPDGVEDAVANSGEIRANDGQVLLSARTAQDVFTRAVNNEGIVRAARISREGGKVMLAGLGAPVRSTGTVDVASEVTGVDGGRVDIVSDRTIEQLGTIDASAVDARGGTVRIESETDAILGGDTAIAARSREGAGGSVDVLGDRVALVDRAAIDVSGGAGGGTARIGGDYQGANAELRNASMTVVGEQATIRADGGVADGGRVILWADGTTRFHGEISARGGAGGFAEVSGKEHLEFRGTADLLGSEGRAGTLLLDPADIVIVGGTGDGAADGTGTFTGVGGGAGLGSIFYDSTSPVTVFESEVEGISADVVLQATNSITVSGTFGVDTNGEGTGAIVRLMNDRSLTLDTRNAGADGVAGIDLTGVPVEFQTQGTGSISVRAGITGGDASGDAPAVVGPLTALGTGSVTVLAEGAVTINGAITTRGGAVTISGGTGVASAAAGTITTTAAANSGVASGAVDIDVTGVGGVTLAGAIDTGGASDDGTVGTASAGGQVDVDTADGSVQLGAVTTSGGDGTALDADGGAAGAIDVIAAGAGRDVTLDGALSALGGAPDGTGAAGAGATVTVSAARSIEDGTAGEVRADAAVLTAGTGGIDVADVLETTVGSLTASGATGLSIANTGDASVRLTAAGGAATLANAGSLGTLGAWAADGFDVDATGTITIDHSVIADVGGIDIESSGGAVALNQSLAATSAGQSVRVEGETGLASAVAGTVTTSGGLVTLRVAGAGTVDLAGNVTTTAAADSGLASGGVDIDVVGAGDATVTAAIVTTGASSSAGTASAGGAVDVATSDGAVQLGAVTASGGAGTGAGVNGGDAATIDVTTGGTGDVTLVGTLTALGGAPGGGGTAGASAAVSVTAGSAVVDGNAGILDVSAESAALAASTGDIAAAADPLEVAVGGALTIDLGGATSAAYVTSPADITLGPVTTGAGANAVSVASTGGNTLSLGAALIDGSLDGDALVLDAGAGGTIDGAGLAVDLGGGTFGLTADTIINLGAVSATGGVAVAPGTPGSTIGLGNLALPNIAAQTFQLDNATLNSLAAAGGGNLAVGDGSSGSIVIDEVSFGAQNLGLVTGSTINDNDDAGPVAFTSTGTLTLTSGGAVGGLNGPQGLNVDVGTLVVTSTAGNAVTVRDAGFGGTTTYDVATSGAGLVSLTQVTGELALSGVSTTGDATLTALAGAITDADGAGAEAANITASTATLTAATGIGSGTAGADGGDIETDVTTLAASTSTGNIVVQELDGGGDGLAIGAGDLRTVGGAVRLSVDGDLTSAAGADIVTTAAANSGVASGAVDIAATGTGSVALSGAIVTTGAGDDGTAGTASAGGQVDVATANGAVSLATLTTSGGVGTGAAGGGAGLVNVTAGGAGDATIGAITALGGTGTTAGAAAAVDIDAGGDVLDGNGGAVNVAGSTLSATAGGTAGTAGDLLETDVTTLTANGAGGVFVSELDTSTGDGLAIGFGDVVTAGGDVRLLVAGDLTSVAGADIVTTAAVDSGIASGAIDIDTTGTGAVSLAGAVRTDGADNAGGTASAAGAVDVNTADGAVNLAGVSARGGDSSAGDGGAGGAVTVTSADAGADQSHDVTLDGALDALGGSGTGIAGAGGTVTVVADGAIVDGAGTAAADIAGATADLTSGASIGAPGNAIDTDVTTLADATAGNGSVFVTERDTTTGDGLTVTNVDAAGPGNDAIITVVDGDLTVATVDAPDRVQLQVDAGDVIDGNGGAVNVTATTLSIDAPGAGAAIGAAAAGGAIDLDVSGTVTANATGGAGGIFLRETDVGGLTIALVDAGLGDVGLEATAGRILDAAGADTVVDVRGGSLTIDGAGGVGVSDADALNLDVTALATSVAIGGDVYVTDEGGLGLGAIDAGANRLSIRAITGDLTDSGSALSSGDLALTASAGGIGVGGAINSTTIGGGPISLTTGGVGAAGDIALAETNGLQTAGASAVSVTTDASAQTVSLTSGGTFTLNSDFGNATDSFVLTGASIVDAVDGAGRLTADDLILIATAGAVGTSGAGQVETALSGTLGATAAAGGVFVEDDSGSLVVSGIDAGGGNVELVSNGTIAQTGAIVNTATLDARSNGALNLATQPNAVATFTADNDGAGGVAFNNASGAPMNLGDVETGVGGLSVTSDSDIAVTGIVDADGALARAGAIGLTAVGGDITQAAGSRLLTSAVAIGAGTGAVTLDRNNDLQSFTAPSVSGPITLVNRNALSLGAIATGGNDVTVANLNGTVTVTGALNGGAGSAVSISTTGSGDIDGPGTVTSDDLTLIAAGAIGAGSTFRASAGGLLDYRAAGGDIAVANAAAWRTSGLDLTAAGARTVNLSGSGTAIVDSALDNADIGLNADDLLAIAAPTRIAADVMTGGIDTDLLNVTAIDAANVNAGSGTLGLRLNGTVAAAPPGGTLTIGGTGVTRLEGDLAMGGGDALVTNGLVRVFGDTVIKSNSLTFNDFVRAGEDGASLLLTTNDPPPLDASGALELGGSHAVFSGTNLAALGNARPTGFGGPFSGTTIDIMASKSLPDSLPGFVAPSIATDYDVRITAPLNAGSSELTIVARGDITFGSGGAVRGRQVNLNALGRQDDPTTGSITDRISGGTGSTPGTFAVQATELVVMIANDRIGSTSDAEGGRFNVDAPLFQLLKGSPEEAQIDPGFGVEDSSSEQIDAMFAAYSIDLGGLGLYSAPGFTGGANVPTIIPGLETTGLGELGFIDEGLFLLPEPYAAPDPATLVPPLQDPDFPGDLRPDDPDDEVAWGLFFDEVLREFVNERYLLPEETDPERIARAQRSAAEELAQLEAFYEKVRERERRTLAAQEEALEEDTGIAPGEG